MTYKPILFNTPMVCAIMDGSKTQTRRLVQLPKNKDWELLDVHPNPDLPGRFWQVEINGTLTDVKKRFTLGIKAPCVAGDVLWVRETWNFGRWETEGDVITPGLCHTFFEECEPSGKSKELFQNRYLYRADAASFDEVPEPERWRPSIHMPKEAARIFLRVQNVRPERLQDITIQGLQEEGVLPSGFLSQYATMTSDGFGKWVALWNSTTTKGKLAKYGWDANPWVWVISFTRMEKPEGWPNV